jgi:hypothetical protein
VVISNGVINLPRREGGGAGEAADFHPARRGFDERAGLRQRTV